MRPDAEHRDEDFDFFGMFGAEINLRPAAYRRGNSSLKIWR